MKKILASVLAALLVLTLMVPALAEGVVLKQSIFAAHGTKCFAVITVAMDGDKIAAAYIDEFQIMDSTATTPVPNAEAMFADKLGENMQLASKRVNAEYYSNNMTKAGSTVALDANYAAIEAYVAGKTVAELEAEIAGKEAAAVVDAVAGCTLVDTLGYINGILDAAKK
ncbi:MAG: hypothetical protein IKJ26_08395 [Clostridia bacterium]|nr:hypothetical protein [Clostridia bacterium]